MNRTTNTRTFLSLVLLLAMIAAVDAKSVKLSASIDLYANGMKAEVDDFVKQIKNLNRSSRKELVLYDRIMEKLQQIASTEKLINRATMMELEELNEAFAKHDVESDEPQTIKGDKYGSVVTSKISKHTLRAKEAIEKHVGHMKEELPLNAGSPLTKEELAERVATVIESSVAPGVELPEHDKEILRAFTEKRLRIAIEHEEEMLLYIGSYFSDNNKKLIKLIGPELEELRAMALAVPADKPTESQMATKTILSHIEDELAAPGGAYKLLEGFPADVLMLHGNGAIPSMVLKSVKIELKMNVVQGSYSLSRMIDIIADSCDLQAGYLFNYQRQSYGRVFLKANDKPVTEPLDAKFDYKSAFTNQAIKLTDGRLRLQQETDAEHEPNYMDFNCKNSPQGAPKCTITLLGGDAAVLNLEMVSYDRVI